MEQPDGIDEHGQPESNGGDHEEQKQPPKEESKEE